MRKTTAIALKLFAILLTFEVMIAIPTLFSSIWHIINIRSAYSKTVPLAVMVIIPAIILAAIGIWILWKTANSLVPKEENENAVVPDFDLDKMFQYAISLIGFFFAIRALISLPGEWMMMGGVSGSQVIDSFAVTFYSRLAQLVLGCFLIAKPRQWVNWLKSIGER